jgi:hypothetical protein
MIDLDPGTSAPDPNRVPRPGQWMELLAAVVMAAATVATAWSAYQSALWNGEYSARKAQATAALIKVSRLSTLALQRTSVHVNLFVHWVAAIDKRDDRLADFLYVRFPEPLKSAAGAWRATNPFANAAAPASPFEMTEYTLPERIEADRWEEIAREASAAAERASEITNRYLLFTIIYASALFFAGIGGKFKWQLVDLSMLSLGALTLLIGLAFTFALPRL